MDIVNLQTLAIISVLTTLTTECIKNILESTKHQYNSNLISAIISLILSVVIMVIKPVCIDLEYVTPAMIFNMFVMAFFGMLASNLGFDKVSELINKLKA